MFKTNDLVTVNSGTTVFRIVETDGDLAVLVRASGSCGEQTVNVSHLKLVETLHIKDWHSVIFDGDTFNAYSAIGNYLLASGRWLNPGIQWIFEPVDLTEKHKIMCVVCAHYQK